MHVTKVAIIFLGVDSKGVNQNVLIHRLLCAIVGRKIVVSL